MDEIPSDPDASVPCEPYRELIPGRRYFALVEAVESRPVADPSVEDPSVEDPSIEDPSFTSKSVTSRYAVLDVVDAGDPRLADARSARRTSSWFRKRWPEPFESRVTAADVLGALESFEGGLAATPLRDDDSEDWEAWHRDGVWLSVGVSGDGFPVDVAPVEPPLGRLLGRAFGMDLWPSSAAAEVKDVLAGVPPLAQTVALDIGQGSANMLVDAEGRARLYFDVGAGAYRNAKTRPAALPFCVCAKPPVVLSHWDTDHWAGAKHEALLLPLTWIAPRQPIGRTHAAHAARILSAGWRLMIVKRSSHPHLSVQQPNQDLDLAYCAGAVPTTSKGDRNDSGLAMAIRRRDDDLCWIYPGDADYTVLPRFRGSTAVLVASHHGAEQKDDATPPSRGTQDYARLLYSFGPNNSYRHPRAAAITLHHAAGWHHSGGTATGRDVLATSRPAGVRGPVSAGWAARPAASAHLRNVHGITPTT